MGPSCLTFSKNVFLPATMVCRDRCDYCTFRQDPRDGLLMTPARVEEVLRSADGATEALFVTGQSPEYHPRFRERLRELGHETMVDYVAALCETALGLGLLPHSNLGVLEREEMERLAEVNASLGLMLECIDPLPCHAKAPSKGPAERLRTIEAAGRLRVPFTTGILVGIGETREQRVRSLEAIADLHRRYGHIQEVIVQPFHPKPGTEMADHPPAPLDAVADAVRLARDLLPPEVAVQIPPNLAPLVGNAPEEGGVLARMIRCGASDLGGISTVTIDYVSPEAPWPTEEELRRTLAPAPLRERLCIYPRFVRMGWYSDTVAPVVEGLADGEGFRRKQ